MKSRRWVCSLFVLCLGRGALAQVLDDTWTLSVNGQSVQANADVSFRITNISAADLFGDAGPGSQPDFKSDDFYQLLGVSTAGGKTRYVFSELFQIRRGEDFRVQSLTFTDVPALVPASLSMAADDKILTSIGQQTQFHVTAILADGSSLDVTPATYWTSYCTSNPSIAAVDSTVRTKASSVFLGFSFQPREAFKPCVSQG